MLGELHNSVWERELQLPCIEENLRSWFRLLTTEPERNGNETWKEDLLMHYRLDMENKGKENGRILQSQRTERMVMLSFKTINLHQIVNSSFCLYGYKLCIHHLRLSFWAPTFSWIPSNFTGHFFSSFRFTPLSMCFKKISSLDPLPWNPNSISSFQLEFLLVKFEMTTYVSNTWLLPYLLFPVFPISVNVTVESFWTPLCYIYVKSISQSY